MDWLNPEGLNSKPRQIEHWLIFLKASAICDRYSSNLLPTYTVMTAIIGTWVAMQLKWAKIPPIGYWKNLVLIDFSLIIHYNINQVHAMIGFLFLTRTNNMLTYSNKLRDFDMNESVEILTGFVIVTTLGWFESSWRISIDLTGVWRLPIHAQTTGVLQAACSAHDFRSHSVEIQTWSSCWTRPLDRIHSMCSKFDRSCIRITT